MAGPVLGPGIQAWLLSFLPSRSPHLERRWYLVLLCGVRTDNVKIFAKPGEPRGGQVRMELSPSLTTAGKIPSRTHNPLDKDDGTMQTEDEGESLQKELSLQRVELEACGAFGVCQAL